MITTSAGFERCIGRETTVIKANYFKLCYTFAKRASIVKKGA